MTSNHISNLVQDIRKELNLTRGVSPQIENVYEHDDNSLHLVASDRAEKSGKKLFRRKFGCNLVAKSHSKGWQNVGPSIFRVLRELEAGVLTTGQSLEYIKDIVRE